jgi:hypothetical protein
LVSGFRVQGLGIRVQGPGFRVLGAGFRIHDAGFRIQDLESMVRIGFWVLGFRCSVQVSEFRV